MMARGIAGAGWIGLLLIFLAGCSGAQGECTYDTDCPQLGYTCDLNSHRCIIDPLYQKLPDRECTGDLDCDPVLEYCDTDVGVCVAKIQPDGGPPGDDGPPRPDNPACSNPDLDCSEEALPGQGRDRDGDLWGECCDCDDNDALVHPQANEVIYDRKDNDCDPATPDGDIDGDGYDANIVGGSDCDDRNANVHPGAEEKCDGLDNNCDGTIDGAGCVTPDGGIDGGGGDQPAQCPDISGTYDILAYCLQISDAQGVVMTQTGCDLAFNLDAIYCTGTIDNAMNLYVSCAGLGFPCTAKASLTSSFTVICSQQCSFIFEPVDSGTPCTFHSDPGCTSSGDLCGIVGENGNPTTVCVDTNPGGRQPGYYCNPGQDIYCNNSLCIENACGGICADDFHCAPFDGTECKTAMYNDGQGTVGNIQVCLPSNTGETRCGRSPDCSISRVCSYRQTDDDVITVCRTPNPGGKIPGEACMTGDECENNLCLCGDVLCDGSTAGVCSAICENNADCIQSNICGNIYIRDLGGTDRVVNACVPDPNSCGRNADCPVGRSCQVFVAADGLSLVTECMYGAGPASDNTGDPCSNDTGCFSVWCNRDQNYCHGVCISDSDCPAYADNPSACPGGDDDCNLQQLCYAGGQCTRPFECANSVFWLGFDQYGQEVYDTVNLCRPIRRECDLTQDCRAGEACTLDYNKTATAARYACYPGFGPGQLGDDCYTGGSGYCWAGLCVRVGGGGPGNEYCSEACVVPSDCGAVDEWDCQAIRVDIRPGFVSYVPACIRL
jgi:hypothetical protein